MESNQLKLYRHLAEQLAALRALDKKLDPGEDARLVASLDAAWCTLSREERQLEEPLQYNSLGMKAASQIGKPLTLVDVYLYVFDPNHVPVVEDTDYFATDSYVKVLQLTISGQPRDRERAPHVGFTKYYSFRKVFREVPPRHVVLMHGAKVATAAAVEVADWVSRAVKMNSKDVKVERWGIWLTDQWVSWDDGEDWTGTRSAAEEEATKVPNAEARPYGKRR